MQWQEFLNENYPNILAVDIQILTHYSHLKTSLKF